MLSNPFAFNASLDTPEETLDRVIDDLESEGCSGCVGDGGQQAALWRKFRGWREELDEIRREETRREDSFMDGEVVSLRSEPEEAYLSIDSDMAGWLRLFRRELQMGIIHTDDKGMK